MYKNKKFYKALLIILTMILSAFGCSSNDNNTTPSSAKNDELKSNEATTSTNSSIDIENTTSKHENIEPTTTFETPTTTEPPTTDKATTSTKHFDDGSISLESTDASGKLIQTISYNASQNITIAYVYEYNESGNLTGTYDYQGDGNLVDEFASGNYDNANMSGYNSNNTTNGLDIDLGKAFEITIGELAPLYKKAEEIWDTYGVAVLIADKVSSYTSSAEQCFDYISIENSLKFIESCLNCYPKNFFRDFSNAQTEVTVCIQVVGTGGPAGLYSDFKEFQLIQMDVNDYSPEDGADDDGSFYCYTLHHEICHMISHTLLKRAESSSVPLTEEKWNSYNPNDFKYVGYYDDDKESELFSSDSNRDYFVYSYSCSTPEEDRAIIFGKAMTYYQGMEYDNFSKQLDAKLKYLSDCIRAAFDSSDWSDKEAWEYILD